VEKISRHSIQKLQKWNDDDDDNNNNKQTQTLSSLLILLHISVPHPSQSHSTLYNHRSTPLLLPLPFLPVSGRLMAVLLLQMFLPPPESQRFVHIVRTVVLAAVWTTPLCAPRQMTADSVLGYRQNLTRHQTFCGAKSGWHCICFSEHQSELLSVLPTSFTAITEWPW